MRSHVSNAGSTRRWRKIRMAAIRRAEFTCGRCGMQFAAARLEIHHIHGRELGDVSANLLCVCAPCHRDIEGRSPSWQR